MTDSNEDAFDKAFDMSSRDAWHDVRIDRARQTHDYLTDLVETSDAIAQFTVSEIIEYLDRYL